jgi:hypothetical protein
MNDSGVLWLAVGLATGIVVGTVIKQCPSARASSSSGWDALTKGIVSLLPKSAAKATGADHLIDPYAGPK